MIDATPSSLVTTRDVVKGKRKTQAPCSGCGLHQVRCLCDQIPKLNLRTKVSLIIHHREMKRTSNTGLLALQALTNSDLHVRGKTLVPFDFSEVCQDDYQQLLLYPAEGSEELTSHFLKKFSKPIQLLVPDGNWRQASKVSSRSPQLEGVPRVRISSAQMALRSPDLFMRKETKGQGMATLEAIAEAMEILEGVEIANQLKALYELKLRRTLEARGKI